MKNILAIIKKELRRFFTDYRMVLSLILPGLMIFIMYNIMGNVIGKMTNVNSDYQYKVVVLNEPVELKDTINVSLNELEIKIELLDNKNIEEIKKEITNENIDLLVIYPIDFSLTSGKVSNVEIYYNSVKKESSAIFSTYTAILNSIESSLTNIFDINNGIDFDLSTDKDKSAMMMSTMLPYLLIIFIYSAVMAVVPESIAGEKDRGTIATLLVTPIKRSELATGKIVSLSIVAVASALSSFIGIILSLPALMQANTNLYYSPVDYLLIAFVLISITLLLVGIGSLLSAFAKSVKEANSYMGIMMVLVVIVGVFSMFGNMPDNTLLNLIPIYNTVLTLNKIFTFDINVLDLVITICSNLAYSVLISFVLARMFNSEKIMFNK